MSVVQIDLSRIKKTTPRALVLRFFFGGLVATFSGVMALEFGPAVGALFLAFPAMLPASLMLVRAHDGEEAAGDDALGAVAGSLGLIAFGVIVWRFSGTLAAWIVLAVAALAWLATAISLWLLARRIFPGMAHGEWLRGQQKGEGHPRAREHAG